MIRAAKTQQRQILHFYLLYTLTFFCTAFLVYLPFFLSYKSFVWNPDGLSQHFNAFVYFGVYVRDIIRGLLFEHQLTIPLWEFGIGYGGDIVTTLAYYVLGDPFSLFSVITPSSWGEVMYMFCIVLRLYFAGIAFCAFCHKMGCGRFASLTGALVYVFCGYAILASVRHPYFMNPMIYLPLILLGVEKILRKESPVLYIVMIFVAAFSNFYFFYMLALQTVLYVLFRFFFVVKEHRLKNLALYFVKFMAYSLMGILMAAVLFLPICMAFLSDARSDTNYTFYPFYSLSYYTYFPNLFVTNDCPGFWVQIGMSPVILPGIFTLFMKKGKGTCLKLQFAFMTLMLLLPVAGYIFNGFGYVCNRWEFAYAFCLSFILVRTIPDFFTLTKRQKWILFFSVLVYSVLCFVLDKSRTEEAFVSISLLLLTVLFIFGIKDLPKIPLLRHTFSPHQIAKSGLLLLSVCGILVVSFYQYSMKEGNYIRQFSTFRSPMKELSAQRENAWKLIEDDSFYRIDETPLGDTYENNHSLSQGQSTTLSYWSITNPFPVEYMDLNSVFTRSTSVFRGLQSRTFLQPFASAKYFVCEKGQEGYVPYGYRQIGSTKTYEGEKILLYETSNFLPLGYTVDTWVPYEEYLEMSFTERQQAMLQGAVLQTEKAPDSLTEVQPTYTHQELPYEVICDQNTEYSNGVLQVKKANAKITLRFDCPADCELYAQITGLSFDSRNQYHYYTQEDWDALSKYDANKLRQTLRFWEKPESSNIKASCGSCTSDFDHYTSHHIYAFGRTDYLFNLCYSKESRSEMTLTFSQTGEYTFDSLSVICQPMTGFEESIASMKEDVLENVDISANRITGDISLDKDKLLCLSIPYSQGWTLYVDGKETELLQTNVMYMGVPLTAGEHQIELRYTTPYLKVGLLLSGVGVAAFIVFLLVLKYKKKSESR